MFRIIKYFDIFLLVVCMTFIFLFSNENSTKSNSTSIKTINEVITFSGSDISNDKSNIIAVDYLYYFRKGAHFIEYLLLGFLTINVIKDYKRLDKKCLLISLLFCIFYSFTDEVHQFYIQGRNCSILDVFIDSVGCIVGILIYCLIYKIIDKSPVFKKYHKIND